MQKINGKSLAKLHAITLGFIGLVLGLYYSVGGFIYELLDHSLNKGTALAFLAVIILPIVFGVLGYALGYIEAFLYNRVISRVVGEITEKF